MLSKSFITLQNEAQFTSEILASGVTQLGKANYAKKGLYFSAFTSISTGLERIGKLCLIIDYYLKYNKFPDENILKFQIGHDLEKIYQKSKEIIQDHNLNLSFLPNLDSSIHKNIISVLSRFAKGDRYSNINFIVQSKFQADPILEWYEKIDKVLFEKRVSKSKKNQIINNAKLISQLMGESTSVLFIDETGTTITSLENSSFKTGMAQAVSKYRQLYVAQIIRYWVEILGKLGHIAFKQKKVDIPFFAEIFPLFNNEDSYLLTRRNFERIR